MSNKVSVTGVGRNYGLLTRKIKTSARKLLVFLGSPSQILPGKIWEGKKNVALDIFLVDNGTIRVLNKKYRRRDKATNVLSFRSPSEFINPPGSGWTLGEIYLAPAYIKEHGEDPEFMLIHGLLHLLGFNHAHKSDRMKMEAKEKELMRLLDS